MSVRRLAEEQPASFEFSAQNKSWAEKEIAKYPPGRQESAVIALLWRAQAQGDRWLSRPAIEAVAAMLDMPKIRALEIATFYTMFNLAPVGRFHVQLCGTTPCMLSGAEDLKAVCRGRIGDEGHVTDDGMFSWVEVECLGACCNAPMVQINEDYYEDLTLANFAKLLDDLAAGRQVRIGSQIGRVSSEPVEGLTALTTLYGPDGGGAPSAPSSPRDSGELPSIERLEDAAAHAHATAEEAHVAAALASLPVDATQEQKANAVGTRPAGIAAPRAGGAADDLRRIRGVGPVNEKRLNDLGVFHFSQIAAWTRSEIRWVGTYLSFPGRIDREQWVTQAANLARGGAGPKDAGAYARPDAKPES